jgi:hypothetical protein
MAIRSALIAYVQERKVGTPAMEKATGVAFPRFNRNQTKGNTPRCRISSNMHGSAMR